MKEIKIMRAEDDKDSDDIITSKICLRTDSSGQTFLTYKTDDGHWMNISSDKVDNIVARDESGEYCELGQQFCDIGGTIIEYCELGQQFCDIGESIISENFRIIFERLRRLEGEDDKYNLGTREWLETLERRMDSLEDRLRALYDDLEED